MSESKRTRRRSEPKDCVLKDALERCIKDRRAVAGADKDGDVRAVQIARRIVVSYGGEPALREFISMLEKGTAGTEIAQRFGVTRQRANQWKDAIGVERKRYEVRPLLRRIIGAEAGGNAA